MWNSEKTKCNQVFQAIQRSIHTIMKLIIMTLLLRHKMELWSTKLPDQYKYKRISVVDACNIETRGKILGYIIPLSTRNINGRNSAHLLLSPRVSVVGFPPRSVQGYFVESASYKDPLSHSQGSADISWTCPCSSDYHILFTFTLFLL